MTRREELGALLGEWVTATSSSTGAVWQGRLVGLADQPTLVLLSPGGGQVCLPQSFDVQRAAPPAAGAPPSRPGGGPRPFAELRDTGLLWLLNRTALHPRGLALALHTDEAGEVLGWSLLVADDGDPWTFDPATDSDGHTRAEATIAAALNAAHAPHMTDAQAERLSQLPDCPSSRHNGLHCLHYQEGDGNCCDCQRPNWSPQGGL